MQAHKLKTVADLEAARATSEDVRDCVQRA